VQVLTKAQRELIMNDVFKSPLVLDPVPTYWEVGMKRVPTVLRFAVAFVCVLPLGAVVVFGQGHDEKVWDDVPDSWSPERSLSLGQFDVAMREGLD